MRRYIITLASVFLIVNVVCACSSKETDEKVLKKYTLVYDETSYNGYIESQNTKSLDISEASKVFVKNGATVKKDTKLYSVYDKEIAEEVSKNNIEIKKNNKKVSTEKAKIENIKNGSYSGNTTLVTAVKDDESQIRELERSNNDITLSLTNLEETYNIDVNDLNTSIKKYSDEIDSLSKKISKLESSDKGVSAEISENKTKLESLQESYKEASSNLEKTNSNYNTEKERYNNQITQNNSDIQRLQEDIDQIKTGNIDNITVSSAINEIQTEIDTYQDSNETLKQTVNKLKATQVYKAPFDAVVYCDETNMTLYSTEYEFIAKMSQSKYDKFDFDKKYIFRYNENEIGELSYNYSDINKEASDLGNTAVFNVYFKISTENMQKLVRGSVASLVDRTDNIFIPADCLQIKEEGSYVTVDGKDVQVKTEESEDGQYLLIDGLKVGDIIEYYGESEDD